MVCAWAREAGLKAEVHVTESWALLAAGLAIRFSVLISLVRMALALPTHEWRLEKEQPYYPANRAQGPLVRHVRGGEGRWAG